ncbi:MAG: UDP-N-acetylmuramate:L-alanyl-gamma-D-glutamyl-meso-diaminopimelate ligase, partial [Candidatus Competibacteraceae bacterium]|nr:UDP-N-acetylmuramate:L-alanyl-gamma-D-glutamyl-meso-diaminopimelate ligase [Candidatus Competibacteraceae bacterium]
LEFDHADIFPDLAAIQQQFHHLLRTVPSAGLIIANGQDSHLAEVLAMGCWTPVQRFGANDWEARAIVPDGSAFDVFFRGKSNGHVEWSQLGMHSIHNGLAAIAAASHAGVSPATAIEALQDFQGVKRRLEVRGTVKGVTVYDDFAHHPTAIASTLAGLRARVGAQPILAVLEPRSNTMKLGVFKDSLAPALADANAVVLYQAPELGWNLAEVQAALGSRGQVSHSLDETLAAIQTRVKPGTHILIMSNGGFGGIHERLLQALQAVDHQTI